MQEGVTRANSGTPVHARHGSGQDHGAAQSLPPGAAPGILKDEEESEGRGASEDGDDDGANEI